LVRDDLLSINSDVQFSFRDNVEPVYRQLVNLLLTNTENGSLPQNNLTSAINLIDSLQLAELENFLRCNLASVARQQNTQVGQNAAFIYPIVLEDRLEVVYKLPGKSFKSYSNSVTRNQVENTADKLRRAIAKRDTETANEYSQTVYQWLIKPLEKELAENQALETIIFVLDSELRNIPMAVLYDQNNKEYLVEKKYALSVLPTSQLFNLRPSSEKLKILAGGISEALEVENLKFEAINAKDELSQISELASTQSLLDRQFNQKALQQKLQNQDFSVLHLATHGNFSSDPEQTYILAYDQLLRPNDINRLLGGDNQQSRIELLVLSACQTASGDNRATLGLAGLAVRAGADSTLATLWKVNDEFTIKLIKRFYQELSSGVSKAEALHRAQKALVFTGKYRNEPYDWGAYILVGNWM
ncbi:MAG: CHAT domain-containing protein, partial [Cyanobacteria bacterium P01_C01_bin.38]